MDTQRNGRLSAGSAARIAGLGYLVIFILAIFANFVVVGGLFEPGDAAATVDNIADSPGLLRAGLIAFAIVFALDVVIAWALWVYFRPIAADASLLAAWLRLVYTVLLGVGLVFFFLLLETVGASGDVLGNEARSAHALLYAEGFEAAFLIGLLCFGVHLVVLGWLCMQAAMPRVLGMFLVIAGVAYALDTIAHAALSNYDDFENIFLALVAVPSVVGELWLALWLLRRGRNAPPMADTGRVT